MNTYDALVVGGLGAVGSLIARLLADDGMSVLAVDSAADVDRAPVVDRARDVARAANADSRQGDILNPDIDLLALLGRASIVVLAVPESVALRMSFSHFQSGVLVVDTLSVKSGFDAKVGREAAHLNVLGINPMFAPSLGMDGRPVAAVTYRRGLAVDEFLTRIGTWGGRVVEVDADMHDRLAAATQALTHASMLAFGTALASLDVDPALVDALAPPPARTALALLARIAGGEPEVYWDVQAGNPYAADARHALAAAVTDLDTVVATASETTFADAMARAGGAVPDPDAYRALCARLFGIVREPAREGNRS